MNKKLLRKTLARRAPLWAAHFTALMAAALLLATPPAVAQSGPFTPPAGIYGNDAARGATVPVNGIRLYHEDHGSGPVVLVLHGNGGDIASMSPQIAGLVGAFRVIAVDSRGHGKSELGSVKLTYEQMADDVAALLDHLQLKQVNVLGWSDGGILGLLLAIKHPDKVGKLAIMGANLNPAGAHRWALDWLAKEGQQVDAMLARGDTSRPWQRMRWLLDLMGQQPNIAVTELRKISAPTLVMAGDRDIIRNEHTLEMFEALPKAHLAIFPGATHFIPAADPALFNQTVRNFFQRPFTRPDSRNGMP